MFFFSHDYIFKVPRSMQSEPVCVRNECHNSMPIIVSLYLRLLNQLGPWVEPNTLECIPASILYLGTCITKVQESMVLNCLKMVQF